MNSLAQHQSVNKLRERIVLLLDDELGANPFSGAITGHLPHKSPIFVGFRAGIVYAIAFCGLPWIVFKDFGVLVWLSVWGSCYLAFASAIAWFTSLSVFKIIEDNILPELAEGAIAAIDEDLARRFDGKRVRVLSFLVAITAAGVSALAIHYDLKSSGHPASLVKIGWLCSGLFILYITAARTTDTARFYGTFATHLKIDADRVYAPDPVHSLLITHIAALGRRVLLFWFLIVCSVATLVPLFTNLRWFVLFVVPVASFFSLGFGTIVFLTSENDIRCVVNGVVARTLRSVEPEIADLFNRRGGLDDLQWKRLQELMALHDKMATTGSYRSVLLSGLSILVPFVGPVAAINWSKLIDVLRHPYGH